MTLLCINNPGLTDLQSRRSSRGKVAACHHLDAKQTVPAPYIVTNTVKYKLIRLRKRGGKH